MPIRTIHCEDCGEPVTTKQPNTKYCKRDRICRDILALGEKPPTRCSVSGVRFYRVNRAERVHPKFNPLVRVDTPDPRDTEACRICGEHHRLVHPEVAVCHLCVASTDKGKHDDVLMAIRRGMLRRQGRPVS